MFSSQSAAADRKRLGAFATPRWLVDAVVEHGVPAPRVGGGDVVVLDPACGDGRFLTSAARRIRELGGRPVLHGIDIDRRMVAAARAAVTTADPEASVEIHHGDALVRSWPTAVDAIVGNPPFLSQLARVTTRGGASRHGGGPYADAAVEFLARAASVARPSGGRIGLVLPQSILASRDAAGVRAEVERRARLTWTWWSPRLVFEADVVVCAIVAETHPIPRAPAAPRAWTGVVTDALGVPVLPSLATRGVLGDRARLSADFRDQFYGLVPAVVDGGDGPPLVTSGLIDPCRCHWGRRAVTFARRRFARPTVELARLAPPLRRWADSMLVPKVLVANQTRVVEAVVDEAGAWLPGVPALTARPADGVDPWSLAAVLTSPVASAWAWREAAGTGLSATTVRLGPRWLSRLPWPAGELAGAVGALRRGDVWACGDAVLAAYGLAADDPAPAALRSWWRAAGARAFASAR